MAAALAGDVELARTTSSRSWRSQSIREVWQGPPDVFSRNSTRRREVDDEEELKWAAMERLPTYDRMRKSDVAHLGAQDKKQLLESILKVVEDDNEKFLLRLRNRTDRYIHIYIFHTIQKYIIIIKFVNRVGIEIPKIEVRFEDVCIEGDAYFGTRALPTLLNSTINTIEVFFPSFFQKSFHHKQNHF